MLRKTYILFAVLIFAAPGYSQTANRQSSEVVACGQATQARQGVGNAFMGTVVNSDYDFSVKIPDGFTGWGGVAQGAPFHGFVIFLDSQMKSCLVFEIHLRVDEEDAPRRPQAATSVQLGKARGWQSVRKSRFENASLTNIRTSFSFSKPDETDDGEVLLIAPTSKLPAVRPTYDAFIRSLQFGQ